MNNFYSYFILGILMVCLSSIFAQEKIEIKSYWLKPVEVISNRSVLGVEKYSLRDKTLGGVLNSSGFSLVRRGNFITQDIYSDGFKRGEINVVVDGERYHSACPNRMDSPLTRVNPLLVKSVELNKTSQNLLSSIGGVVSYSRREPESALKVKSNLLVSSIASNETDFSLLVQKNKQQVSARYLTGKPYKNSDNLTFKDLYGYKDNYRFTLAEVVVNGVLSENMIYDAGFTYSDNVSFPYLKMDERKNKVFNASFSYLENKIYFNYTDHLMDNSLRVSPMFMETKARNLTIGVVGKFYEMIYRNWNMDNHFNTKMGYIYNHMMPRLSHYILNATHSISFNALTISGRIGGEYFSIADKDRLEFYKQLQPNAKTEQLYVNFSLAGEYQFSLANSHRFNAMIELAGAAPEAQQLYIGVNKPMGKPTWVGNPQLDQQIKLGGRFSYSNRLLSLELFGHNVHNYVNLENIVLALGEKFVTYDNVDAFIFGANFNFAWEWISATLNYNYGENLTSNSALSEIQPLKISVSLLSPTFYNVTAFIRNVYSEKQNRIDLSLNEMVTGAWNRVDVGVSYSYSKIKLSLEVDNLLNRKYNQHLSYQRDPFASGAVVYEPGLSTQLNISYGL